MLKLLDSTHLWTEAMRLRGSDAVTAAVAYANSDHLQLRASDTLVCDASDARIAAGATSHRLLSSLAARGVALWHFERLHAKVIRLSKHVVVGSANMTENSRKLVEAAFLTDDAEAVRQVDAMLAGLLQSKNLCRIDKAFLKRIECIPVRLAGGRKAGVDDRQPVTWLMAYRKLSDRERDKSNAALAALAPEHDDAAPYFRVTLLAASQRAKVQLGDRIAFVSSLDKRVKRPVVVTGIKPVGSHLYYWHNDLAAGGISWDRVQSKLIESGALPRPGVPIQLALSNDAAEQLNRLFRRRERAG